MEVSSSHQMYVFVLYLLLGMLCGVFFDVQRFLRRLHRAGKARTQLEDVLFAIVCVGAMLGLSYFFNNGEIRYYQIMGSISGALLCGGTQPHLYEGTQCYFKSYKAYNNTACYKNLLCAACPNPQNFTLVQKKLHEARGFFCVLEER